MVITIAAAILMAASALAASSVPSDFAWTALLRVCIPMLAVFLFVILMYRMPKRRLGRTLPGAFVTVVLLVIAVVGNSWYWYAQDLLTHSTYQAGVVTVGVILFSLYIVVLALLIGFAFNVALSEPRSSHPT